MPSDNSQPEQAPVAPAPPVYAFNTEPRYRPCEIVDVPALIAACADRWYGEALGIVNESLLRLSIVEGEFHWHSHDDGDEFFFVLEGALHVDLDDTTVVLGPHTGFIVPRGTRHRTRAPARTAVLALVRSGNAWGGS